ncbi:hypothetical protein MKZ38_003570 [Zalerion maritima]|uniref:Uncharacterized protein n=1 Tax=Zalerion maritima TaxID=339359 RepID=A0AAD5RML1_9PEZI|nr:hypothetical protein MKZ38_003570 [Zalerion maritima]
MNNQSASIPLVGNEPFKVLGRGTMSTVYHIPCKAPNTSSKPMCLKTGHNSALLRQEFDIARDIFSMRSLLDSNNLRPLAGTFGSMDHPLPQIPWYRQFHQEDDSNFWGPIKTKIQDQDDDLSGILMDRIPSMPAEVGKMLIQKYFDRDEVKRSIQRGRNKDFLVQLQFGKTDPEFEMSPRRGAPQIRTINITTTKATFSHRMVRTESSSIVTRMTRSHTSITSSNQIPLIDDSDSESSSDTMEPGLPILETLNDLPASLLLIKSEIPSRAEKLVASIAAGYAMLQWGSHIDGSGTEFVLAPGTSFGVGVWMLDFDKCQRIDLSPPMTNTSALLEKIIAKQLLPVILESGFVPKKGAEDELEERGILSTANVLRLKKRQETLWEVWRDAYVNVGEYCVKFLGRKDLKEGPSMACRILEERMEQDGMDNEGIDDLVVFADDDEDVAQDDGGWGSDDLDDDEDDSDKEEEDYLGWGSDEVDSQYEDDSDSDEEKGGHSEDKKSDKIHLSPNRHSQTLQNDRSALAPLSTKHLNEFTSSHHASPIDETSPVSDNLFQFSSQEDANDTSPDSSTEGEEEAATKSKKNCLAVSFNDHEDWDLICPALPDPMDPEELIPEKFLGVCRGWYSIRAGTAGDA